MIDLASLLKSSFEYQMSQIHTAIPAEIVSYDYKTKKATVQPVIKQEFDNGDKLDYPVISNVPVLFPGSSDFVLHFELKKGDGVLLVFAERSLENWLNSRTGTAETGDPRKFNLSDAIAIPGLFNFNNTGKVGEQSGVQILYKGASIKIGTNESVTINGHLEILK